MSQGRVYVWTLDPAEPNSGRVTTEVVPLLHLDTAEASRLRGRYVHVRNAGVLMEPDPVDSQVRPVPIGDAAPDANGDFLFEPRRGGGRIEKFTFRSPKYRLRYIEASHFGEVNTYYHLDRLASYLDELLREIGAPSLPPVTAVVNAHNAAVDRGDGIRDGVRYAWRWVPFQGGHYRLPGPSYKIYEHEPVEPAGEIHLGPGWKLLEHGALVSAAGGRYRANASHNAPILYHEYGHHLTRHTADFRANSFQRPDRQNNIKAAIDEGICDYWTAVMLGTHQVWAWHRRQDEEEIHARNLTSAKTMADYDHSAGADPHANGTIWAAALWELRRRLGTTENDGGRLADKLVVQSLVLIGRVLGEARPPRIKTMRRARESYATGLAALIRADELLSEGRHRAAILDCFNQRGIQPAEHLALAEAEELRLDLKDAEAEAEPTEEEIDEETASEEAPVVVDQAAAIQALSKRVPPEEIPASEDLYAGEELAAYLKTLKEPPLSVIVTGDTMLGGRTRPIVAQFGKDYPFGAVRPLLKRAPIVLGNLEGPFAREAPREQRNYSYRVNPELVVPLKRAGFSVMTLANNHLLDCGRKGVLETLDTLQSVGIAPLGAGVNKQAAHVPVIQQAGPYKVGLLGYYWNRRTAARPKLPGSAMDPLEDLEADIGNLRGKVDRIVVTFHWGVPYEREPSTEDREKARFAIDCGADAVIGHHPHIVQPFEIYRDCPIFYSVGNFAFGSGNSKGEGLLVGLRFEDARTLVDVYAVYVKNRDPRVHYQPKVLRGQGAARVLHQLAAISAEHGPALKIEESRGRLELPWASRLLAESAKTEQEILCRQ